MRTLQACSFPLGVVAALLLLPADAVARKQMRGPALAPDQLVTIRSSLVTADRAEVALVSGIIHRGKIEAVTESDLVLKVRPQRRGPWQMQVVSTQDIQHLRLFHSAKPDAKARAGRTLGLLAGIFLAGPAVAAAAQSEGVSWPGRQQFSYLALAPWRANALQIRPEKPSSRFCDNRPSLLRLLKRPRNKPPLAYARGSQPF